MHRISRLFEPVRLMVRLMKPVRLFLMFFTSFVQAAVAIEQESGNSSYQLDLLLDMSLKQLLNLEVRNPAALGTSRYVALPSSVTSINQQQIALSSARSLNELLEIYVPGLQWIYHAGNVSHLGVRGIISDRDDKYLLLVNGHTMNQRTSSGQISERDLPLLSDIAHIEVIRGPGSATMGLGAVSMIINITTFDATNFQGGESNSQLAYGQALYSQEFKYSEKSRRGGLFLFAGISNSPGASPNESPYQVDRDFTSRWGDVISQGESVPGVNDRAQYRDQPSVKLHADFQKYNWQIWGRYTRGGEVMPLSFNHLANETSGGLPEYNPESGAAGVQFDPEKPYQPWSIGYQQLSAEVKTNQPVAEDWLAEYRLGFDMTDYERDIAVITRLDAINLHPLIQSHREDKWLVNTLWHWQPKQKDYELSFGTEYVHELFGKKSPGYPGLAPTASGYRGADNHFDAILPRWSTNTASFFLEHQWRSDNHLTSFLGGRLDKNTYTDWLLSPRLALVYEPTQSQVLKVIASRSQRMNFASELRERFERYAVDNNEPEILDSLELSFDVYSENVSFLTSLFSYRLEAIGFDPIQRRSLVAARQKQWGIETEFKYRDNDFQLMLSHAYTKLDDFELIGASASLISAGESLNNWAEHVSKATIFYSLGEAWAFSSSWQYYWGFSGIDEFLDVMNFPVNKADKPNAYWHTAAHYQPAPNLKLSIAGHYLLGLFDMSLNKRNYFVDTSGATYREQALSLSLNISYQWEP